MKKIILILLLFAVSNCGFSPVNQNINDKYLKIVINEIEGEKSISNILKRKLKKYDTENIENVYILNVKTSYSKNTLSKDKTGRASDLKLSTTINFNVLYNNQNYNFSFTENLNIERLSDFMEQNNYENEIKENFVNNIVNQLIFNLKSVLNDT